MTLRTLKIAAILFPPIFIGGFEYLRHEILSEQLSMELGNWLTALISLILSYFFASFLFYIIEKTNRRLTEEQTKRAIYEERERVARELHDDLAQILFFLQVSLKKGKVEEAGFAVSELDNHLRQAIFNLRSNPEDTVVFQDRLKRWIEEWSMMTGIRMQQLETTILPQSFTSREEIQLFAIVQEAFTNIRKHSQATEACIKFIADHEHWELTISDNGRGIDPQTQTSPQKYGLSIIGNRAKELGATMEFINAASGGTTLRLVKGSK